MQFFATTAKGMEPVLAQELREIGALNVQETRAGATFEGTLETAYLACLWSRIANRILLPLKTFPAPNPEKLYGGAKSIRWSDHVSASGTIAVDFSTTHSEITHSHYGALKVKDAIVDQLRSVQGERPSVDIKRPDLRVNVYLNADQATVSIDLSGESLHRRGYRDESVPAPMKENLAGAILAFANWRKVADEGGSFIDPMCGSGTLPIEAALIAARIAPGLARDYHGFKGWLQHDEELWARLCDEARDLEIRDPKKQPVIVGYDRDIQAVRAALAHVERAGLRGRVHIERRDFSELEPVPSHAAVADGALQGLVVINPPYGERLGEEEELKTLYAQIGDTFKKKFQGWEGYVLTGSPELGKEIGLKPARRIPLFNGAIECRLFRYELFAGSRVSKPGPSTSPEPASVD